MKIELHCNLLNGKGFYFGSLEEFNRKIESGEDYEITLTEGSKAVNALLKISDDLIQFFDLLPKLEAMEDHERGAFVFFVSYGYDDAKRLIEKCLNSVYILDADAVIDGEFEMMGIGERHPLFNYISREAWLRDKLLNRYWYEIDDADYCDTYYVVNPLEAR